MAYTSTVLFLHKIVTLASWQWQWLQKEMQINIVGNETCVRLDSSSYDVEMGLSNQFQPLCCSQWVVTGLLDGAVNPAVTDTVIRHSNNRKGPTRDKCKWNCKLMCNWIQKWLNVLLKYAKIWNILQFYASVCNNMQT